MYTQNTYAPGRLVLMAPGCKVTFRLRGKLPAPEVRNLSLREKERES